MEINGDVSDGGRTNKQGKNGFISKWKMETEFHKNMSQTRKRTRICILCQICLMAGIYNSCLGALGDLGAEKSLHMQPKAGRVSLFPTDVKIRLISEARSPTAAWSTAKKSKSREWDRVRTVPMSCLRIQPMLRHFYSVFQLANKTETFFEHW